MAQSSRHRPCGRPETGHNEANTRLKGREQREDDRDWGLRVQALAGFVRAVDRANDAVGRAIAWLTLAMVLITFLVVILRYVYALGWVWMQESYVWLHGIVFMIGAGYTLLHNGHVRVDIFYRPASHRYRAWVDAAGALFLLLPLVVLIFLVSEP
jgi:TRAP-type mannitol/chloroaromatic compound transport system permease small subunit